MGGSPGEKRRGDGKEARCHMPCGGPTGLWRQYLQYCRCMNQVSTSVRVSDASAAGFSLRQGNETRHMGWCAKMVLVGGSQTGVSHVDFLQLNWPVAVQAAQIP